MQNQNQLPLAGIKVLELEGLAPTVYSGLILADFGADVIIVNRPESPIVIPVNQQKNNMNRGKRSIVLDFKNKNHLEILKDLIQKSDILIDPYRPGVLEKLGIGPNVCHQINPKLIIARVTGYGQTGPLALRAGHDINYLSYSGMLSTFGKRNQAPIFPGNILADFAGGGTYAVLGILLALIDRQKTNKGQVVDCAMYENVMYLGSFVQNLKLNNSWNEPLGENLLDSGCPYYNIYKCKDNRYLAVGCLEPQFYKNFIKGLRLSKDVSMEMLDNQFNKDHWPQMEKIFINQIQTKTMDEWTEIFDTLEACVSPILNMEELPKFNQVLSRKMVISQNQIQKEQNQNFNFQINASPQLSEHQNLGDQIKPNPIRGQHSLEILKEFKVNLQKQQEFLNWFQSSKL